MEASKQCPNLSQNTKKTRRTKSTQLETAHQTKPAKRRSCAARFRLSPRRVYIEITHFKYNRHGTSVCLSGTLLSCASLCGPKPCTPDVPWTEHSHRGKARLGFPQGTSQTPCTEHHKPQLKAGRSCWCCIQWWHPGPRPANAERALGISSDMWDECGVTTSMRIVVRVATRALSAGFWNFRWMLWDTSTAQTFWKMLVTALRMHPWLFLSSYMEEWNLTSFCQHHSFSCGPHSTPLTAPVHGRRRLHSRATFIKVEGLVLKSALRVGIWFLS